MTSNDLLDDLKLLWALPRVAWRPAMGWLLDILRALGGISSGLLALLLLGLSAGMAFVLQRRIIAALDRPGGRLGAVAWLRCEVWGSALSLPFWPLRLAVGVVRATARLAGRFRLRKQAPDSAETAPAAPAPEPLLVASLGPSFLLAGLATALLYGAARLADPLLRAQLGLSRGLSAWQFLLLGRRPEAGWYLPLERYPFLAGLLSFALWGLLWSLAGTAVRLALVRHLGRNLVADRENPEVLALWRRGCGAPSLASPSRSYLEWAAWPVAAAAPLLVWAWFSLGGDPYRIAPGETAVAVLLWTSWALHLTLRGRERLPAAAEAPAEAPETRANGWTEILAHLAAERQVAAPRPWEVRTAEPLQLSEIDPGTAGFLSPLVAELLPSPRKLTSMQRSVLTRLALQGFVHTDPPVNLQELSLGEDNPEILEDRSGQRVRHQVVLAPEGKGKTTLALLAVANHALVHTRSTLIVVRGEEGARSLAQRFRRAVEPSPLRWNIRVRHPGADLMNDLAQGIIPDVVICSLRDLVLTVLDRTDTFAPFLRSVGLIVVDDVESFIGPVEVHAQLAFRRLALRLEDLLGLRELGDKRKEAAPQFLILGCDSMQETGKWATSLCGVDAVVRNFSRSASEEREREAAEMAASGIAMAPPAEAAGGTADGPLPRQRVYRLRDFRSGGTELLGFEDLIAACERLAVPWHYRLCGDGRRDLGRGPLPLREEPLHYADSPEDACVLLLEGTWSEVRRESRRLVRAGARFSRFRRAGGEAVRHEGDGAEEIALVLQVDPDVEMAFTHFDPGFSLAPSLEALPRPVLRPPTGLAVDPHLTADLVQHWTEVEEVVRVFGAATAPTLRRLAGEGLLLCEPRIDVNDRANDYVEQVYVRALARAVRESGDENGASRDGDRGLLPPKVAQVEVAAQALVAVRDRTNLIELGLTDDESAHLVHYPGRIFKDARGTYVVVGRAVEEGAGGDGKPAGKRRGDVLVEPLLTDEISSPRRQFQVRALRGEEGSGRLHDAAGGSFPDPHAVLLGRHPFEVSLEPVEIRVEHIATYRLGPVHWEIRQRALTQTVELGPPLPTVGLILVPNPGDGQESGSPPLTLGGARLLAAALRAVLPVLYRGAGESLLVALHLEGTGTRRAEEVLGPGEGFCLFDAEAGGNGMARAIYRDGLELPLRLCRLLIERVLTYDRLCARYDEWGQEDEIVAESREEEGTPDETSGEAVRHAVLEWLDSRLQPEGGPEGWQGSGTVRSGSEAGEGDLLDLGRCWYSREGSLSDLVWSRHRWTLPSRGEAMLDAGFDRATVTEARLVEPAAPSLAEGESPAAREVWFLPPRETEPKSSREAMGQEPEHLHRLGHQALTAVLRAAASLLPLAGLLRERSGSPGVADLRERVELARYLAAFVRAIPTRGAGLFRSPVDTLLRRAGDERSKSLLLATLLRCCGIEAGVFLNPGGSGALTAAALPDPGTGSGAEALPALEAWAAAAGLSGPPGLWATLPAEEGSAGSLLVPISVSSGSVGAVFVEHPETWVLLPLSIPVSGGPQE